MGRGGGGERGMEGRKGEEGRGREGGREQTQVSEGPFSKCYIVSLSVQ